MTTQAIARRRRPRGLHACAGILRRAERPPAQTARAAPQKNRRRASDEATPGVPRGRRGGRYNQGRGGPQGEASHAHSVARRPSRIRGPGSRRVRPLSGLGPAHDSESGPARAGRRGLCRPTRSWLRRSGWLCPMGMSREGRLIEAHRSTAWRWVQAAVERALSGSAP